MLLSSLYNYSMDEQKILENFGLNLKYYRSKAKMSQDDIVEITGFSKAYISSVENAKFSISLVNAMRLAEIFGKTVDEMTKEL